MTVPPVDGAGRALAAPRAAPSLPKVAFSRSCAARSSVSTRVLERVGLLGGEHALLDEPRGELLADGRVRGDALRHQRLRVRRLVLLVVAEAPVADEVDDDVVAEAAAVREREPDRRDRRLGVVGVDVDDRDVEALREVARVARRAALRPDRS